MRYPALLVSLSFLAAVGVRPALAALTEVEPNSTVTGSELYFDQSSSTCSVDTAGQSYCTTYVYRAANAPVDTSNPSFSPYGGPALDPTNANALSLNDETRGQLGHPRDFDWFYVDISAAQAQTQGETPVYFGCDNKFGVYYEGFGDETPSVDDTFWQVNYYYDADPNTAGGLQYQSSYVVYKDMCKRGVAETKGPFRFQMNTARPGRYYVRIAGRYVGDRLESEDSTQQIASGTAYTVQSITPGDPVQVGVLVGGTLQLISIGNPYTSPSDGTVVALVSVNVANDTAVIAVTPKGASTVVSGNLSPGQSLTLETKEVKTTIKRYYNKLLVNTAFYGIRLYTAKTGGELEPNDGMVESFPLTAGSPVQGQLSSMYDEDWFHVDNDTATNTSNRVNIYFKCTGVAGSQYVLSSYNHLGVLQNAYQVSGSQCSSSDGFTVSINTPVTARYYLQISSPDYDSNSSFTQSDYTLTVLAKGSRLPGEMEPNDTQENAFPLTTTQAAVGQLYSASDLDYFYLDVNLANKSPLAQTIYFTCAGADSAAQFVLSTYNSQGSLQQSYTVSGSQCAVTPITTTAAAQTGFSFPLPTPNNGRYYVLVAGPADKVNTAYSNVDYRLSTFLDVAAQMTPTTNGRIANATINEFDAANKDNFVINLSKCGQRGTVKLVGKRLNLENVDDSTQVLVQIGSWSCLTGATPLTQTSDTNFVYPAPAQTYVPPPAKPQITGSN